MKIGVLFNCQNQGIAASLRALLPEAEVVNFTFAGDQNIRVNAERAAILAGCDHVITQNLGSSYGRLGTAALTRTVRNLHTLHGFAFGGFHPDTVYVEIDGTRIVCATGDYHSRIAIAGYVGGLNVRDTAALYNRLVFSRLGYFSAFAEHSALLGARWARDGIDLPALMPVWLRGGCFTHTVNHPKIHVLLELARAACRKMGIVPSRPEVDPGSLPDALASGPSHPLFPDIAAAIGVPAEGGFCMGIAADGRQAVLSPEAFVARCFTIYAGLSPAGLMTADGVAEAVAALGLTPRRQPPRDRLGPGMTLMTYHGTTVRTGPAAGQLRHLPLTVPDSAAPPLRVSCLPGAAQPALGGAEIAGGKSPVDVAFRRDGVFLCAEGASDAVQFDRPESGIWEHFLPLSEDDVRVLRRVLGASWFLPQNDETIPQSLIRITEGPALRLGRHIIDLRANLPALAEEGGEATLTIDLEGEAVTLREQRADQNASKLAGFRPGRRLTLAGGPVWLPPPVTACDADRLWLYGTGSNVLNGRTQPNDAVLSWSASPSGDAAAGVQVAIAGEGAPAGNDWMEAALRLHILAAIAPADARYQRPDGLDQDDVRLLQAAGFGDLAWCVPGGAAGVIRLENRDASTLPAEALVGLRNRLGLQQPGERKIALVPPGGLFAPVLEGAGFTCMDPAHLTLADRLILLEQAGWIAGDPAQMPLVACPPAARVIDITNAAAFTPYHWIVAAKLGLTYGIVPAADAGAARARLAALLAMMAFRS